MAVCNTPKKLCRSLLVRRKDFCKLWHHRRIIDCKPQLIPSSNLASYDITISFVLILGNFPPLIKMLDATRAVRSAYGHLANFYRNEKSARFVLHSQRVLQPLLALAMRSPSGVPTTATPPATAAAAGCSSMGLRLLFESVLSRLLCGEQLAPPPPPGAPRWA